jgi:hypothetical protein
MHRRKFVKTIIVGGVGVASGIPFTRSYASATNSGSAPRVNWRRVVYKPAHQLRDGHTYNPPEPSEQRDIVIVGAGPTSLSAAFHLAGQDILLLEKEPTAGGNAQQGIWRGTPYTNGTAYLALESPLIDFLAAEFDLRPTPLHSNDAYITGNKVVLDLFRGGIRNLPYSESVRKDFERLTFEIDQLADRLGPAFDAIYSGHPDRDDPLMTEALDLEEISFLDWLQQRRFSGEVISFCNLYCPAQASSFSSNMSAMTGIVGMNRIGDYAGWGTFPGGLAVAAEALADAVRSPGEDRIRTSSFVVKVANSADGRHVYVTYLHGSELKTIQCKTCIWGAPMHIARRAIVGMTGEQTSAIDKLVYNDISVMNLCYRRTIYDGAYYTWIDQAPVTNVLPADWVTTQGRADPARPQVLSCDWPNRPERRALLLNDEWVIEQCQRTAQRLNEVFPGSMDDLEEIHVVLRAHSWVVDSPSYYSQILPNLPTSVGRVLITDSDQNSFNTAFLSGVQLAQQARDSI